MCDDCLLGFEEKKVVFIMTNTLIETLVKEIRSKFEWFVLTNLVKYPTTPSSTQQTTQLKWRTSQ